MEEIRDSSGSANADRETTNAGKVLLLNLLLLLPSNIHLKLTHKGSEMSKRGDARWVTMPSQPRRVHLLVVFEAQPTASIAEYIMIMSKDASTRRVSDSCRVSYIDILVVAHGDAVRRSVIPRCMSTGRTRSPADLIDPGPGRFVNGRTECQH